MSNFDGSWISGQQAMRKIFYGWRRKAGVVVLLVALLLIGRWMRGQRIADIIGLYNDDNREILFLQTSRDGLMWEHQVAQKDKMPAVPIWRRTVLKSDGPVMPFDDPNWLLLNTMDRRWRLCGFDFGRWHTTKMNGCSVTYWNIPYWSVILPLTLLAASLILSKPRIAAVEHGLPPDIDASRWPS